MEMFDHHAAGSKLPQILDPSFIFRYQHVPNPNRVTKFHNRLLDTQIDKWMDQESDRYRDRDANGDAAGDRER